MKSFLFLLVTYSVFGQNYVPKVANNKFGISDLEGNFMLQPQFEKIEIIDYNCFKYSNTLENGLIIGNKVIIKNENYENYEIHENQKLITASNQGRKKNNKMLFNFKGENLLESKVRNIEIDKKNILDASENLIMVSFEKENKTVSVFIYDTDLQVFVSKILENVSEFDAREKFDNQKMFRIKYKNNVNEPKDVLLYFNSSKKCFEIKDFKLEEILKTKVVSKKENGYSKSDPPTENIKRSERSEEAAIDYPNKAEESIYSIDKTNKNETNNSYVKNTFNLRDQTTISYNGNVAKKKNTTFFILYDNQKEPVIYALKNKKGLLLSDVSKTEAIYNDLKYIKETHYENKGIVYYLASKKDKNKKLKYGILNQKGEEVIPIIYDSLSVEIPNMKRKIVDNKSVFYTAYKASNSNDNFLELNDHNTILVKNNDKYGIINFNNEILAPINYDAIYVNKTENYNTNGLSSFIILKKDNKYGVLHYGYKGKFVFITTTAFPEIPTNFFFNYNGILNYHLFTLSSADKIIFCYADSNGKVFLENK